MFIIVELSVHAMEAWQLWKWAFRFSLHLLQSILWALLRVSIWRDKVSRILSFAWNFLLMLSFIAFWSEEFLLNCCELPEDVPWPEKGRCGREFQPGWGRGPLLKLLLLMKLTSSNPFPGQLFPVWLIFAQCSQVIRESCAWTGTASGASSSFYSKRSILAVSMSWPSIWWTARGLFFALSCFHPWLLAIFSMRVQAVATLKDKKDAPAAASRCSCVDRCSPWKKLWMISHCSILLWGQAAMYSWSLSHASATISSASCWKLEILFLRELVFPRGKYFTRKAFEHASHVANLARFR